MRFLFELILDLFSFEFVRFIGVCALWFLGVITGKGHSFSDLWNVKFDKKDEYKTMIEKSGQRIAGFMVITIVAIVFAVAI